MSHIKKHTKLLISSTALSFAVVPFVVSCSQDNSQTQSFQDEIDQQYKIFYNALKTDKTFYIQNFNFNNSNSTTMSLKEISSFIVMPELSTKFNYEFVVSKQIDNQNSNKFEIQIEMLVKEKNKDRQLNPSNINWKTKIINNIESKEINEATDLYQKLESSSIAITNSKNETLSDFSTVLPSFVEATISSTKITINDFPSSSTNFNLNKSYSFNDAKGEIIITLDLIDKSNGLKYYVDNYNDVKNKIFAGFSTLEKKSEEIESIFKTISRTFSLKSVANEKILPYLPSSITNINEMLNLYKEIVKIKDDNEHIKNIIELLEKNNTEWFNLTMTTTNANDVNGTLTVEYNLFDKFTGFQIKPNNITRTATLNNMLSLTIKDENDKEDYSQLENAYQAYNLVKTIKLLPEKSYSTEPSTISTIDLNYLTNNTNIQSIVPQFKIENEYIMFSLKSNEITNNFRFNITNTKPLIIDNIRGIVQIPIQMQIELKNDFDNDGSIGDNETQWINFLPPKSKNIDGTFNSAAESSNLMIGNYLTNELKQTNKFYSAVNSIQNNLIEIIIKDETHYNDYLETCSSDESKIEELFADQIKYQLFQALLKYDNSENTYNEFQNILETYEISLDLTSGKSVFVSSSQTNKYFELSDAVNLRLKTIADDETNSKYIDWLEGSTTPKDFPKIKIKIKYEP